MIICKVIGHVWATKKEPRLEGLKLMVVQEEGSDMNHAKSTIINFCITGNKKSCRK